MASSSLSVLRDDRPMSNTSPGPSAGDCEVGVVVDELEDHEFPAPTQHIFGKSVRDILALLKLEGLDVPIAAEVLVHAPSVDKEELPAMISEAFDLIRTIFPLTKADQKFIAAAMKFWLRELERRGAQPHTEQPQLQTVQRKSTTLKGTSPPTSNERDQSPRGFGSES